VKSVRRDRSIANGTRGGSSEIRLRTRMLRKKRGMKVSKEKGGGRRHDVAIALELNPRRSKVKIGRKKTSHWEKAQRELNENLKTSITGDGVSGGAFERHIGSARIIATFIRSL